MTVVPLPQGGADVPLSASPGPRPLSSGSDLGGAFSEALGAASDALVRADASERAYLSGAGGLQEMVLDRARADVTLSFAAAAASRTAQALSTILGMQV